MAGPPSFGNYQRNAADNTGEAPYGAPEGWAGRLINDTMRELMAAGRRLFDDTPRRYVDPDTTEDVYANRAIGTLAYQQREAVDIRGGSIGNVPGIVPVGSVTLWWGTLADAVEHQAIGFIVGDGRRVVRADGLAFTAPDLRDIFPYFYSAGRAPQSRAGSLNIVTAASGRHDHGSRTGGTAITVANLPAIGFLTGAVRPGGDVEPATSGSDVNLTGVTGGGQPHDHGITAAGDHTHTATYLPPHAAFIPLWRGW